MRMQKLLLPITIMAAFIIGANGCSSIDARTKGSQSGVYPGVKAYKKAHGTDVNATKPGYKVIDLPLSFALDTGLLPIDILRSALKGKDDNSTAPKK